MMDSDLLTSSQDEFLEQFMSNHHTGMNMFCDSDDLVSSSELGPGLGLGLGSLSVQQAVVAEPPFSVPATLKLPSTERFEGLAGFGINLHGQAEGKAWIFSVSLNKVFINVGNKFPVQFMWIHGSVPEPRVRAVMMFMAHDSIEEGVQRCNHHSLCSDKSNLNFKGDVRHVVRTEHELAEYWTDPVTERHSLVVPLQAPQAGTCGTTVLYSFVCKNSCPSGMNRRPTQIVFTLEDRSGQVYGREAMPVRICSCPKRDKDKEEADIVKTHMARTKTLKRPKLEAALPPAADEEVDTKRLRFSEPTVLSLPVLNSEMLSVMARSVCGELGVITLREKRPLTPAEQEVFNFYSTKI